MKHKKIILGIMVLCISILTCMSVAAASNKNINAKAVKAYQKILKKGYYTYRASGFTWRVELNEFTLIDINRDGIKEMITQEGQYGGKQLWVFDGKKAKRAVSFTTYQGASVAYDPLSKAVGFTVSMSVSNPTKAYLRIQSRSKLKQYIFRTHYEWIEHLNKWEISYYLNNKHLSKKMFNKRLKSINYNPSTSYTLKFYKNSASNRNKMNQLKAY